MNKFLSNIVVAFTMLISCSIVMAEEKTNSLIVFDSADYHFNSLEEYGLPQINAYTHTGFYLGWLIENNLLNREFLGEVGNSSISEFLERKITAPKLFSFWDGVLTNEMLNEEGVEFSKYYFDFSNGEFAGDYVNTMALDLPSLFHVTDNWENYEKVKAFISKRHKSWLKRTVKPKHDL